MLHVHGWGKLAVTTLTDVGLYPDYETSPFIGSLLEPPSAAVPYADASISFCGRLVATLLPSRLPRPKFTFTTQVDGVDTMRRVFSMRGGTTIGEHVVNQPTEEPYIGPGSDVEFLVYGEGSKRTEVFGPYTIDQNKFISLDVLNSNDDFPGGQESVAYSETIQATNYYGTVTWAQTGTLPPGLSFSAGVLSGTPSAAGTYKFTISARDGWDQSILYRDFTVVITV